MSAIELPVQTEVGNNFVSNYPPYSQWSAEAAPQYLRALDQPPVSDAFGIYLHVPFCAQRCAYCYFRVHVKPPQQEIERYLSAIVREARLYAEKPAMRGRRLTCLYFGGGTPSFLSEDQLERLIGGLRDVFDWSAVEEFTIECNPESLTAEKLDVMRSAGVTRLSLGFQTLNDDALRRSGRARTCRQSLRAFRAARNAGFDQLNVDLLAGLPGETEETWIQTVDEIAELTPDCVTVYQMQLTHNSAFYAAIRKHKNIDLPEWPVKRRLVDQTFDRLERAGYRVISSYMALARKARWRFVYTEETLWKGGELLGLGESAFGHLQGIHYQNQDQPTPYLSPIEADELPLKRALRPTEEEKFRREVILLLRLGTLERSYFRDKFGVELYESFGDILQSLADDRLATLDEEKFELTRLGLLNAEWLMPLFYLPEHRGVRYS